MWNLPEERKWVDQVEWEVSDRVDVEEVLPKDCGVTDVVSIGQGGVP